MMVLITFFQNMQINLIYRNDERYGGKCICVCKRNRTTRSSIRMGWDHMVSEDGSERFVFLTRAGPLCLSECSKMHLCGHHEKGETVIGTHQWVVSKRPDQLGFLVLSLRSFTHTLTCIIRGLHLHVHLQSHVKREVLLSSMHCVTIPKISQKILRRALI